MAALPYMQLYVADYMADTAHLDVVEHGAYLLLLMTYWQRGKPLPNDDAKLARIARCTDAQWAAVRPHCEEFFQVSDVWKHKRIDADLKNVKAKSNQASGAANSRWQKGKPRNAGAYAGGKRTKCHTDKDIYTPQTPHRGASGNGFEKTRIDPSDINDESWDKQISRFKSYRDKNPSTTAPEHVWSSRFGKPPDQRGCVAPHEILRKYGFGETLQ